MKNILKSAVVIASLALLLTGCANSSPQPTETPNSPAGSGTPTSAGVYDAAKATLLQEGKLLVCTHNPYKPFQYNDPGDKTKIIGFDVDLIDVVAQKLGVTQEIVDIDFEQIHTGTAFAAGKCDAGAAGMTITDKRKEATEFSQGYFDATQALMVSSDSPVSGLADLKGKILAAQTGTTGEIYANDHKAEFGYEVKIFDNLPSTANSVLAKTADAAINDNTVLYDFVKENPTTKVVAEFDTGEQYGVNAKKGNTALIAVVDEAINEVKSNGKYAEWYLKYFGQEWQG
ncbi:MAG: transporter substrate-binding domain-containing protein [Propionibacteriaceae bacterium]|jgi:polar amino acid transport system substrate-binding protein|nr:transporter substrate-binding domain-containing protein [Propionibacteriaceae bacterium]